MKYAYRFLITIVTCSFFIYAGSKLGSADSDSTPADTHEHLQKARQLHVRVLLDVRAAGDLDPWHISGKSDIVVTNLVAPSKKKKHAAVHAKVAPVGVVVTDVHEEAQPIIAKAVRIQAPDGYLCLDGTWYQGSLYFIMNGDSALLINNIALEDYIYSVLKSESWPSWPVEMHKVLAIASRTYVIAKIIEAQKYNRLYHIKNTNVHQTYTGYHEIKSIKQAVEETRDLFLAHNDRPIMAMYDICCGGLIPSKKSGVNFNHAPYLARTYACTFCKKSKVYNWSVQYTPDHIEALLKREIPHLRKIKDIKVVKKDHAGAVQKIVIKAASGHHHINGKKMYSLLKEIKSFCYSVAHNGQTISFNGRGYGHHMGLCQWGARQMVREGWPHHRILQYYYPSTQLMRLERA